MKRIIAQARKELTQVFRDRLTVALALVLPLILLALLGTALSLSVKGVAVVVQDFDRTPLSRQYLDLLNASLTFRVVPSDRRPDEVLASEQARVVIIIPENFKRDYLRSQQAEVQWLIDAVDANTANTMRGQAVSLTRAFAAQLRGAVNPPLSILSGATTPVEAMLEWMQPFTLLNPISHFAMIARGILLRAAGAEALWPHLAALIGFAVVLVGVSAWRFRKQLG